MSSKLRVGVRFSCAVLLFMLIGAVPAKGLSAENPVPGKWTKSTSNPIFSPGSTGSWEDTVVSEPSVVLVGSTYHMWYTGENSTFSSQIGHATSTDGLTWIRDSANPVLIPGPSSWDSLNVGYASVILDGSVYKMWYTGQITTTFRIGYATSTNGTAWVKQGTTPVLDVGPTGSWDAKGVSEPVVIKTGGTYKMWYHGGRTTATEGIGYATSPDGIVWTKSSSNPVITRGSTGSWDETAVYSPDVLFNGSIYQMWYSGSNAQGSSQVVFATSSDGVQWFKQGMVLPQGLANSYDGAGADRSAVMLAASGIYKMWYSASSSTQGTLAYATAPANQLVFLPLVKR